MRKREVLDLITEYAGRFINEEELKSKLTLKEYRRFRDNIQRAKTFRQNILQNLPKKTILIVGAPTSGKTTFAEYFAKEYHHLDCGLSISWNFQESVVLDICTNYSLKPIYDEIKRSNTHLLMFTSLQPIKLFVKSLLEEHYFEYVCESLDGVYYEIQQNGDICEKSLKTNEFTSNALWQIDGDTIKEVKNDKIRSHYVI